MTIDEARNAISYGGFVMLKGLNHNKEVQIISLFPNKALARVKLWLNEKVTVNFHLSLDEIVRKCSTELNKEHAIYVEVSLDELEPLPDASSDNRDIFVIDEQQEKVTCWCFNPDSAAGGCIEEYVFYGYDAVKELLEETKTEDAFYEAFYERANLYSYDKGSETYMPALNDFERADFGKNSKVFVVDTEKESKVFYNWLLGELIYGSKK